jgi:hypothetical protein
MFIRSYWEDAKRTGEVMRRDQEGVLWMHTGDEGILDSEGYLKSQFEFLIY